MGLGCLEETTHSLAASIHCKSGRLPITYLVLPTGAKPRSISLWNLVIKNFERKLSSWKKQYLSLGKRITLIRACLSNLLVYYMSLFKVQKAVEERSNYILGISYGRVKEIKRNYT